MEPGLPWRAAEGALLVTIRLTPRGGRDALAGIETLADGRAVLAARVRAAPTEGEANAALVKLLAKSLRIPASQIRFVQGETARVKTLQLSGDGKDLAGRLSALLAGKA